MLQTTWKVLKKLLKTLKNKVTTAMSESTNKGQSTDLQGLLVALSKIPCHCPKHKEYHILSWIVGSPFD